MWMIVLFRELKEEKIVLREWARNLGKESIMAVMCSGTTEELRGSLAVIDAKRLYDHLSRETIGGGQDRRNAIHIQIVREDLKLLAGQVRWVADTLTKLKGSKHSLFQF